MSPMASNPSVVTHRPVHPRQGGHLHTFTGVTRRGPRAKEPWVGLAGACGQLFPNSWAEALQQDRRVHAALRSLSDLWLLAVGELLGLQSLLPTGGAGSWELTTPPAKWPHPVPRPAFPQPPITE